MKQGIDIKSVFKLGFTLAVFAAAACVGLAFVYSLTADIIAERQQADLEKALKEFFPNADSFTVMSNTITSPDPAVEFEAAYEIRQNGAIRGAALRVSRGSYGGTLKALIGVGLLPDGSGAVITGVRILEHQDTPGLGANAASPSYYVDKAAGITFYGQFTGKAVFDPFEVKQDVLTVTASTVTSRAIASAVKAAGQAASEWLAGRGTPDPAVQGEGK
jgi:electron transport complex protein RnfG